MASELSSLREHPFMRGMSEPQLKRLFPCAREVQYEEDARILREGEHADTLYLIRTGCVVLEQHIPGRGVVSVESLCAGDLLGLSWLLRDARWTLDARCTEPVQAFALRAGCVRACMEEDPALGLELLTHVATALYQRLVRVRLQRLDVYKAG